MRVLKRIFLGLLIFFAVCFIADAALTLSLPAGAGDAAIRSSYADAIAMLQRCSGETRIKDYKSWLATRDRLEALAYSAPGVIRAAAEFPEAARSICLVDPLGGGLSYSRMQLCSGGYPSKVKRIWYRLPTGRWAAAVEFTDTCLSQDGVAGTLVLDIDLARLKGR